jgi:hypothetical protein
VVVNNEIWMDSGAMVSMIPEQDIFLGAFAANGATDLGDGTSTLDLNIDFTDAFALVANLYRGCKIEFYLVTTEAFVDECIIVGNAATTITVPNTILSAIVTDATTDDYYGLIKHLGAPVPAPKGSNPRLLADNWIGLTDTVSIPTTAIEMKQIPVSSGSRSMAYQFKGAETTSAGSFSLSANNFSWLYYVLGKKTISAANTAAIVLTDIDAQTTDAEFYAADNGTTDLAGTNFIFDSDTVSDTIHRVEGNTICPPWNVLSGTNIANVKSLSHTLTNKITYTFLENNSQDLPSFALEYTLRKPSLSTVATDVTSTVTTGQTLPTSGGTVTRNISDKVYTKIYPGCQVESVNITADAGQEVKMNVNFNSKTTFTAPASYDTANNTTHLHDWVNFGSMQGGQANVDEGQLRPFFFSDGTIEMFGQEYIRIENMTLDIANSLQPKRFIGRYDKTSQTHLPGQRTYNIQFTGLVTDNTLFEELRNGSATSLTGTDGHQLKISFRKDLSATAASDEIVTLVFKDYMVTSADFPLTNDKGPITVTWAIQPLELHSCTHTTNWVIQG